MIPVPTPRGVLLMKLFCTMALLSETVIANAFCCTVEMVLLIILVLAARVSNAVELSEKRVLPMMLIYLLRSRIFSRARLSMAVFRSLLSMSCALSPDAKNRTIIPMVRNFIFMLMVISF